MSIKKLSELDKKDRTDISQAFVKEGEKLEETYDHPKLGDSLGMCSDCKFCAVTEFEFKGYVVYCNYHDKAMNQKDRVVRCNSYTKRGQISLYDMQNIAWIIDNDPKVVGFIK